jgi:RNA polymerase sigma-70 factor (ECF subfamily)
MTGPGEFSDKKPAARHWSSTSYNLLDRAKAGDAVAWQQLEFLYRPLVRFWCRRRGLRQAQDMEDATQEVFWALAGKIGSIMKGPKGSFRSLLYTMTRRKVADHFRRRRKQLVEAPGGNDAQDRLGNVPDTPPDRSADEDSATERTLLIRRALKLVSAEFQPRTWEAAWRVVVEEQPAADVAAGLGMKVGTVYTAKSRVLGRLREVLEDLQV